MNGPGLLGGHITGPHIEIDRFIRWRVIIVARITIITMAASVALGFGWLCEAVIWSVVR